MQRRQTEQALRFFVIGAAGGARSYQQLAPALRATFRVYPNNVLAPEAFINEDAALKASMFALVVVSPDALDSAAVQRQIDLARLWEKPLLLLVPPALRNRLPLDWQREASFPLRGDTDRVVAAIQHYVSRTLPATHPQQRAAAPPPVARRRRWWLWGGAFLLLIALGVVLMALSGGAGPGIFPAPANTSVVTLAQTEPPTSTVPPASPIPVTALHDTATPVVPTPTTSSPTLPGTQFDQAQLAQLTAPATHAAWEPLRYTIGDAPVVFVPQGCFLQGLTPEQATALCADDAACLTQLADEQPARQVCLTAFWLDRDEVSRDQFSPPDSQLPQTQITWTQAETYCRLHGGYLVTEAQWEYAARGPEQLLYITGETLVLSPEQLTADGPLPVGQPGGDESWVGAYHLNANVSEWVLDTYQRDAYATGAVENPVAQTDNPFHVVRGASWATLLPVQARLTARDDEFYDNSPADIGFRCAYPLAAAFSSPRE